MTGRVRLGHVALGAAVAAKLYPVVLAPLTVAYVWKREGRREALVCSGLMLAVVAVVFAPFVAVAPGGVWDSLWNQASRPLQIESLGAGILLVAHQVFGTGVTMESSHGSQNLAGTAPEVLAVLQTFVQWAALPATLGPVRPRAGDPGAASPRERRRARRLHRARQGALAAVPDLADPGRSRSSQAVAG